MTSGCWLLVLTALAPAPAWSQALHDGVSIPLPGVKPDSVVIADLNADGKADVALGERFCGSDCHLTILYLRADGTLSPPVQYAAREATSIAAGDLNEDGRVDVAVAGTPSGCGVTVFFQQPDHTLSAQEVRPTRCVFKVAIGDVTHDGREDLVALPWGSGTHQLYVYEQQSGGALGLRDWTISGGGYDDLHVADVTGDGLLDVVVVSPQTLPRIAVRPGNASMGFGDEILLPTPWGGLWAVDSGDFNRDGVVDIAVVSDSATPLVGVLYLDSNGHVSSSLALPVLPWPASLESADVDRNGLPDFVTAGFKGTKTYLHAWLQGPVGTFRSERYLMPAVFSNFHNNDQIATGDLNGDGLTDVAVALDGGALAVFLARPNTVEVDALDGPRMALLAVALAVSGVLFLRR